MWAFRLFLCLPAGGPQMKFDVQTQRLFGDMGSLPVAEGDEVTRKLVMLIEGQCEGLGPSAAAKKYSYTKQRYFQLLHAYLEQGSAALSNRPRGPKRNYRRTSEVVRQVIRHRFLDPEASPHVIAQKLRQTGFLISIRSVERVIADYGLQKKTLQLAATKRDSFRH
jgi:transposase